VLIALAVVVVGAVTAAVVVARSDAPEPDADEALDRAAVEMESAGSFRLREVSEDRSETGEAGGAGSASEYRTVVDAELSGDEWRATTDSGDYADEAVALADSFYTRSADSVDALAGEQWVVFPGSVEEMTDAASDDPQAAFLMMSGLDFDGDGEIDDDIGGRDEIESLVVPALADYYLFGLGEPTAGAGAPVPLPSGFIDTFGSFEDAEVVSDDGETLVISATRHLPADFAEGIDIDMPAGVFEITLGADDLPTKLTLTVDGRTAHHREDVTFSDWGADITIGVPEGEIDHTPWVDEEAVAAARATVAPLAPTAVPDGLVLSGIDGLMPDDETEPCPQLYLTYAPPLEDQAATDAFMDSPDYLDIYLLPADCATDFDPTPFEAGEFGDLPSRTSEEFGSVEVMVGDTVVQFDTSYDDELAAMVASLAPFDLDAELARTGEIAQQLYEDGLYFEL
jgi:hypothetical protein